VHCTKISPEFKCRGQRSRSSGTKAKKMLSRCNWQCMLKQFVCCRPYAARSSRRVHCVAARGWRQRTLMAACMLFCRVRSLGGTDTLVGKSAHAVWFGYLYRMGCKWFTYGPAGATATSSSLASLKSRMVLPSVSAYPGGPGKEAGRWLSLSLFSIARS